MRLIIILSSWLFFFITINVAESAEIVIRREKTGSKATIGTISVNGIQVCEYLEYPTHPPFKFLPKGKYDAFVRTDGKLGWRVELKGTAPFTHIQIHAGNSLPDTEGCFLAGKNANAETPLVEQSQAAMRKLRTFVEKAGGDLKVVISDR